MSNGLKYGLVGVAILAAALSESWDPKVTMAIEENKASIAKRREFERTSDDAVRNRVDSIKEEDLHRKNPFPVRREVQDRSLDLPKFPTTTIGSFPVGIIAYVSVKC